MKELQFGKGDIAISAIRWGEDSPATTLALEPGVGAGEIGVGNVPSRKKGMEVGVDTTPFCKDAVMLHFSNPESVQVMIDGLEEIKADLLALAGKGEG